MANGLELVRKFIEENNVKAEILTFTSTVESVKSAAMASGFEEKNIIKTLLLKCDDEIFAVMLPGDKKLDYKKIKKYIGCRKIRLLYPHEVKEVCGMNIGEVSPLTHTIAKLKLIADQSIVDRDIVLVGGGSLKNLVKINVKELIRVLNPELTDISK